MAPRKEKAEKASADQGATMVLEYLRKQNRPYSATDVSSNLHNKVTKTAAAKYLKLLHEKRKIEERISGKQAVYHIIQEAPPAEDTSADDTTDLDAKIDALKNSVNTLKAFEKSLKTELAQYGSFRSLEEIQSTVSALESQKQGLVKRIDELKTEDIKPCSEKEKLEVETRLKQWKQISKDRREIVKNLWELFREPGICPEGLSMDEYWIELGCEGVMPIIR